MRRTFFALAFLFAGFAENGGMAHAYASCRDLAGSNRSCFLEFDGPMRGRCEVCREGQSCFLALNGRDRDLCQAYVEDKSCFLALNGTDRAWCEVLKEGKSCFFAFNGSEREDCERGYSPWSHEFWRN